MLDLLVFVDKILLIIVDFCVLNVSGKIRFFVFVVLCSDDRMIFVLIVVVIVVELIFFIVFR